MEINNKEGFIVLVFLTSLDMLAYSKRKRKQYITPGKKQRNAYC